MAPEKITLVQFNLTQYQMGCYIWLYINGGFMKLVLALMLSFVSFSAFAKSQKYCGVVSVYGTEYYTYAMVNDANFNPTINGDTADKNKVVKLIKNGSCYCVEGTMNTVTNEFVSVEHLHQCNGGPKIK